MLWQSNSEYIKLIPKHCFCPLLQISKSIGVKWCYDKLTMIYFLIKVVIQGIKILIRFIMYLCLGHALRASNCVPLLSNRTLTRTHRYFWVDWILYRFLNQCLFENSKTFFFSFNNIEVSSIEYIILCVHFWRILIATYLFIYYTRRSEGSISSATNGIS